jgi:hypothetical protein
MNIPYWYEEENENEVWFDYKCEEVVFPEHEGNLNGEVTTWNINNKQIN